jgi:leader peptidase (prepilin peptidase)/N-methyltransferase
MVDPFSITALCFIFGAIVGSFLGVCAFRVPMGKYEPAREDLPIITTPLSITSPRRSFCPRCSHQLKWHHTIPIVSWIALRGRCAFCHASIPARYCAIEIITGIFAALCYLRFGVTPTAVCAFALVSALIVITFIDLDYMIIPNVITYPGTFIGLALAAMSSYAPIPGVLPLREPFVGSIAESLFGILSGAGTLLFVWWFYLVVRKREGLGLGDIKLLAMIGALLGPQCALITIFLGSVLGSVVGITLILFRRHSFANYLPFGPYLVIAALICLFNFSDLLHHLRDPSYQTMWVAFAKEADG